MLGELTTPNALSAGSPERYWACVRYFSACTNERDLRIRYPFLALDPHQRGILSDDFGVALSTTWLARRMGGVREIVDGRRFVLNFGLKKRGKRKKKTAKVGPNKCPDFVLQDLSGRFHVLECKGTQTAGYLTGALRTGQEQKAGIEFDSSIVGERLVIGISLKGEGEKARSSMRIVDPTAEVVVKVSAQEEGRAKKKMDRLGVARALNLIGLADAAAELSWPVQIFV